MPKPLKRSLPPLLVNRIARYLFNGMTDEETSLLVNLPISNVKALRAGNIDTSVRKKFLELKNHAIERVIKGRGKLGGLMWFLERRWPREYAKAEIQLTYASGHTTNNTIIVAADVAQQLTERSRTVLSEVDALIRDKEAVPES